MAGVKISALPVITTPALSDVSPWVQGGVTYQVSNSQLISLFDSNIQLASSAQVTGLATSLSALAPLAGATFTGTVLLNGTQTASNAAATVAYAQSIAAGLNPIAGVAVATTANLNATYANGVAGVGATLTDASGTFAAFTVDGQSPAVGSRVLVKNQTTTYQNGIYVLTTNGDTVSIPYVLTRATDYNMPSQINPGDLTSVELGTVNAGSTWFETATVVTIGVSAITWSVFFSPENYVQVANLGTGVNTALGVNVGTAGAFVVNGGALGTPSSGVGTNLTGIHGRLLSFQDLTTGTAATYTPTTTSVSNILVEMVGGGGGGGASNASSTQLGASGGGGGGGYCSKWISSINGSTYTATYTVGAGGASVTAGSATTWSDGTFSLSAGGGGTRAQTSGTSAGWLDFGGTGGTSSGGDINEPGQPGTMGVSLTNIGSNGGNGGNSRFGGGALGNQTNATGAAAVANSGGGGAGASNNAGNTTYAGGAGGSGLIRVWEFS